MLGLKMTKAEKEQLSASAALDRHDTAYWLFRINEASVVGNVRQNLLDRSLAIEIREALKSMEFDADNGQWMRPEVYITFEPELLKRAGMTASVLHVGRSSQDMLSTSNAAQMREGMLFMATSIANLIESFMKKADQYWDGLIPLYTNGVQAQPNRMSHYLYAQAVSWERFLEQLLQCIKRYNFSPMGAAVLNGSCWSLDQSYTAKVLGFDCVGVNAFDAGQLAGNDMPVEMAQLISSAMVRITGFLQDFSVQYAQTRPWMTFNLAGSTYISSAMPQKRNPGFINNCRRDASSVMAETQNAILRSHNLMLGMPDARDIYLNMEWIKDALSVLNNFQKVVDGLTLNEERALEEINSDWSCTQNIADTLVKEANLPFRLGHHFASHFVTWAKKEQVTPMTVTYEMVCEQWDAFVAQTGEAQGEFPLTKEALMCAMDPKAIVQNRLTMGGPQEAEMQLQKTELTKTLCQYRCQIDAMNEQIETGIKTLSEDLQALV